jgi:hypothetical protein
MRYSDEELTWWASEEERIPSTARLSAAQRNAAQRAFMCFQRSARPFATGAAQLPCALAVPAPPAAAGAVGAGLAGLASEGLVPHHIPHYDLTTRGSAHPVGHLLPHAPEVANHLRRVRSQYVEMQRQPHATHHIIDRSHHWTHGRANVQLCCVEHPMLGSVGWLPYNPAPHYNPAPQCHRGASTRPQMNASTHLRQN